MTRKLLALCLALLMVSALSVAAFADDVPTLVVGTATAEAGNQVDVYVSVSANGTAGVAGFALTLPRSDGYELVNAAAGQGGSVTFSTDPEGAATIQFTSPYDTLFRRGTNYTTGNVLRMTLKAKDNASGDYTVTLISVDSSQTVTYYTNGGTGLADRYGSVSVTPGTLTVTASSTPVPSPSTAPDPSPSTAPDPSPSTAPDPSPSTAPDPSPSTVPDPSPSTAPDPSPSTAPDPSPSSPVAPSSSVAPTGTPPKYMIRESLADRTWDRVKDAAKDMTLTSSADFSKFVGVKLDSEPVVETAYSVANGSTKVTLSSRYLATLELGAHTLAIESNDGAASAAIFIVDETSPSASPSASAVPASASPSASASASANGGSGSSPAPKTGDESNVVLWIVVLAVLAAAAVAVVLVYRKKSHN